ncbi:MAG: hypothetical protein K2G26_05050, partial [Clostridia bacterium]|nr:hypothetical protein [Clostridia bacterium]
NNPVAAMNYLLSTWKNSGVYTVENIPVNSFKTDSPKKTIKAIQRERSLEILKKLYDESDGD